MNTNIKIIISFSFLLVLVSSCATARKGTSRFDENSSPYVKEQKQSKVQVKEDVASSTSKSVSRSEPIMVREEKVRSVDLSGTETIYRYYVIIGSFQVIDNARNYRSQLVQENFTPVILESEIGFFRVSVAAYNDEMAARDRIAQIRNNYENYSDVWLLIRKN